MTDSNTGNYNTGNRNTGYYNTGHCNTITPQEILIFNKLGKRSDWERADKPSWMFAEIKAQINDVASKAIEEAIDNITKEVGKSVDSIALRLVKEYSIQDMGTHILIHVRKSI